MAKQRSKKIPLGTRANPWYVVPEHVEGNKVIPTHFVRFTAAGVWREDALPAGAIVKRDTTY